MEFLEHLRENHNIILNPQQEQAVKTIDGATLLLAVPGSGKTTVIITRLGNMIFNYKIPPENILNITFSKASAQDMKQRFSKIFGDSLKDRLEFRTIHSFCLMVLKEYYRNEKKIEPKLIEDNFIIIKKIYIDLNQTYVGEEIIKDIIQKTSYCTNMLLSNDEIKKIVVAGCDFPEIFRQYNEYKINNNQIDFDDMLYIVYEIFKNNPSYLEKYQDIYRFINLDEAQDTSFLQHEIIRLLAQKYNSIFMVGDEDQSIYGFRAAFPKALLNFEKTYKNAIVLKMERNYRSTKNIVIAANQFIKQNKDRFDKNMFCENEEGVSIKYTQLDDLKEQYSLIISKIKGEYTKKNLAILYRNNDSAVPIVDVLEREGIHFSIRENTPTFFTHFVTNDILSYIKLANNFRDIEAFEKIYFKLNIGISKKIFEYVKQNLIGDVFDSLLRCTDIDEKTAKNIKTRRSDFILLRGFKTFEAISFIEDQLGYSNIIKNISKQGFSLESMVQKLNTLKLIATRYPNQLNFLERIIKLRKILETMGISKSNITLSTVHSSKGLEFDVVYIIDAIDGQFPTTESIKQRDEFNNSSFLEEETRLFYVGITRARSELNIISSNMFHGKSIRRSRFIDYLQNNKMIDSFSEDKDLNKGDFQGIIQGCFILHSTFGVGKVNYISGKTAEVKFENRSTIKLDLKMCLDKKIIKKIK